MSYIITCDDCGMHEGINHAALELHQAGMAHSASILTNFPATQHALELFKPYPDFHIGAHLNLSEGLALTGASPLTDKRGRFLPIPMVLYGAVLSSTGYLQAAETEFMAQIDVLRRAGIEPEHITTHMHFHVIPSLRELVLRLAQRYQVQWVRAYRARDTVIPKNPLRALRENPPQNTLDYLAPMMYWVGTAPHRLTEIISALQGTIEIVVHPANATTLMPPLVYSGKARFREVEHLKRVWKLLHPET